jgi:UPF0271 protein
LDTSAFIAGFNPFSVTEKQYSVPAVRKELVQNSMPWVRFNAAVESKRLKVRTPIDVFFHEVTEASKKVGDERYLSETDFQVLALALELKCRGLYPMIVTDDYSIQNVANQLGIDFTSLLTYGIKFRFNWIQYCPACHRKYPPDHKLKACKVCGTTLKRKPLRKTSL